MCVTRWWQGREYYHDLTVDRQWLLTGNFFVARFLHGSCSQHCKPCGVRTMLKAPCGLRASFLKHAAGCPFCRHFVLAVPERSLKVSYNGYIPGSHNIRWIKQGSLTESVQRLPSLASYIKHFFDHSILHSSYMSLLSKVAHIMFHFSKSTCEHTNKQNPIPFVVSWPWMNICCPPKPLCCSPPQLSRREKI